MDGQTSAERDIPAGTPNQPPCSEGPCLAQPAAQTSSLPTEHTQYDTEYVSLQFSRTGFVGIRSLPDALAPEFRTRMYEAMVLVGKLRRQALKETRAHSQLHTSTADSAEAQPVQPVLAYSTLGPALQVPVRAPPRARSSCHVACLATIHLSFGGCSVIPSNMHPMRPGICTSCAGFEYVLQRPGQSQAHYSAAWSFVCI